MHSLLSLGIPNLILIPCQRYRGRKPCWRHYDLLLGGVWGRDSGAEGYQTLCKFLPFSAQAFFSVNQRSVFPLPSFLERKLCCFWAVGQGCWNWNFYFLYWHLDPPLHLLTCSFVCESPMSSIPAHPKSSAANSHINILDWSTLPTVLLFTLNKSL